MTYQPEVVALYESPSLGTLPQLHQGQGCQEIGEVIHWPAMDNYFQLASLGTHLLQEPVVAAVYSLVRCTAAWLQGR